MGSFRDTYHSLGGKLNRIIMGIGITKGYLTALKGREGEQTIINDCVHNCIVIEEGALQLEQELAYLKKLSYRLMDPDRDLGELTAAIEAENHNLRILVVDDDESLCDIIRQAYMRKGFQVDSASTKDAALKQLAAVRPDIVILDLYFQEGREGLDILRAIKALNSNIKTVVITSEDQEDKLRAVRALGPEELLLKPVRGEQLEAKINGLIALLTKLN
ncbi:MAG: response regulator [Candidatus Omnitrophica bacterium]|nr:response regulator [Candidatus Omnitrophota bacterium]